MADIGQSGLWIGNRVATIIVVRDDNPFDTGGSCVVRGDRTGFGATDWTAVHGGSRSGDANWVGIDGLQHAALRQPV